MSTAVIILLQMSTETCRHFRNLINDNPHTHNRLMTAILIIERAAMTPSLQWLGYGLMYKE
jgi:hypothetical protein